MASADRAVARFRPGSLGRGLASVGAALTGNPLFAVLLAGGALLRVIVTMAYQPALLLQMDAYGYLRAAAGAASGVTSDRAVLYPLVLKPLLAAGGLAAVPVAQHITALALTVALYLLIRRMGVAPTPAALGVAPVLVDGYQLNIEQYVLAETLFDAFVVAGVVLLAWRARPPLAGVLGCGIALGLAGLTRQVGLVLILPALAYVIAARLGWLRAVALLIAFLATIASSLLWLGESSAGRVAGRSGFYLYGRVASFAQCSRIDPPKRLRTLCLEEPPSERGPNYGVFGPGFDAAELSRLPDANRTLLSFSVQAILAQPAGYAGAVLSDFWRFLSPEPPPRKEPYVKRWRFPRSLEDADPHPFLARRGGSAPPRLGFESFRIDRDLARPLRAYQSWIYTYGPLLAVALAFSIAALVVGERYSMGVETGAGRSVRADLLLLAGSGTALLLTAVMISVYHFRYVLVALPLLPPAGVLGATLLVRRIRPLVEARR